MTTSAPPSLPAPGAPSSSGQPNRERLRKAALRERAAVGLLSLPALLLVVFGVVLPCGWLLLLSFVGVDGSLSWENYARMIDSPSYYRIFETTFQISLLTTLICIALGYPLAYVITLLPGSLVGLALLAVLVPFWTSMLVRTYAWLVILQNNGVINSFLISNNIIAEPIALVHNFTGTLIGTSHIMLPFLVLPLYNAMRSIDRGLILAAASLGASPTVRFWTVYFPLTLPGLIAGALLVFVLSLGFYITPAILGGGKVIMAAMRIQSSIALYANWGAASAIAAVLLAATVLFPLLSLWLSRRVFGAKGG